MIKEFCDKITKWQVIKDTVNSLGKIDIVNDEIYCYVDGKKLKDGFINVKGMFDVYKDKSFLIECGLYNKPINYVFYNIIFEDGVYIDSCDKTNLIFEKCAFYNDIQINHADSIVFKNNKYYVSENNDFSFVSFDRKDVNYIIFCGDKLIPIRKDSKINEFLNMSIDLKSKKIAFNNSSFFNVSLLNVDCDKFVINNNIINTGEFEITTDKIVSDHYNDIFVDFIVVDDKSNNYSVILECIFDNMFFYGVEIDKNIDCYPNDKMIELQRERVNLIDALRTVYNNCSDTISDNLIEQETIMKKQSITKVLKK